MDIKIWSASYRGASVQVVQQVDWLRLCRRVMLVIDDVPVKTAKIFCFKVSARILARYGEKDIEIRIARKSFSPFNGAQIFVDGVNIGGDTKINFPKLQQYQRCVDQGFMRYFLKGLLGVSLGCVVGGLIGYWFDGAPVISNIMAQKPFFISGLITVLITWFVVKYELKTY